LNLKKPNWLVVLVCRVESSAEPRQSQRIVVGCQLVVLQPDPDQTFQAGNFSVRSMDIRKFFSSSKTGECEMAPQPQVKPMQV
jgi:hypothetical protein